MKYTPQEYINADIFGDLTPKILQSRNLVYVDGIAECHAGNHDVNSVYFWLLETIELFNGQNIHRKTCRKCLDKYLDSVEVEVTPIEENNVLLFFA